MSRNGEVRVRCSGAGAAEAAEAAEEAARFDGLRPWSDFAALLLLLPPLLLPPLPPLGALSCDGSGARDGCECQFELADADADDNEEEEGGGASKWPRGESPAACAACSSSDESTN
mgnify:CR=1 FL=1